MTGAYKLGLLDLRVHVRLAPSGPWLRGTVSLVRHTVRLENGRELCPADVHVVVSAAEVGTDEQSGRMVRIA